MTKAVESLHMRLRKIVKNCGHFPRRSGDQIAVSRLAQHRERLEDASAYLKAGCQPIRHHVRRALHELNYLTTSSGPAHRISGRSYMFDDLDNLTLTSRCCCSSMTSTSTRSPSGSGQVHHLRIPAPMSFHGYPATVRVDQVAAEAFLDPRTRHTRSAPRHAVLEHSLPDSSIRSPVAVR